MSNFVRRSFKNESGQPIEIEVVRGDCVRLRIIGRTTTGDWFITEKEFQELFAAMRDSNV